jgi:ADP-ribose pyrophosphatase YjhB (NUDIX family)
MATFDQPEEPEWHRMISVAAYYLAEQRGFAPGRSLDDWLQAEDQIKESLRATAPTRR